MLILGMVLAMCGIAGTAIGLAYYHPSQAAAHSILHPLARVAVILGPIALLTGAAMSIGSAFGMRRHHSASAIAMAPIDYKSLKAVSHKAMDEEEAGEEMLLARSGWRKSY